MPKRTTALVAALLMIAAPAVANEYEPSMRAYIEEHVAPWVSDPAIVAQVKSQNKAHETLSQGDIDQLDQDWRAQVGASETPLISTVLSNEASQFLLERVGDAGGVISEVFVTDNLGLNVASSGVTSDYWQGDEAKFTEVYGKGPEAMHFGDIEFDDSAQTYLGQISVPVTDPDTGTVIGVMTIGLDAEAL
ncbi:MAG: hypothetical protein AAGF94_01590 [Pseudomonadota bacterium]